MTVRRDQIALNAIQWINVKADPSDPSSEDLWLYSEPSFRADYPRVLAEIREAGFEAVMMEVLDTQTLQDYRRMIEGAGLKPAPGYASIPLPEDHGVELARGSAEWVRWFDGVRRKAEESAFFGLSTVFLAPEVSFEPWQVRTVEAAAVGAASDAGRLERLTEVLAEAAEVLSAEGVKAGLHNHVGTWIETREEIDHVLSNIDPGLLGASFDIGHLVWAGIDPVEILTTYRDRILDLHLKDLDLGIAEEVRRSPEPYRTTANRRFFLEPGLGDIDFAPILAALPEDFGGWIILEVDKASMDPFESAQQSRKWVEETFPA